MAQSLLTTATSAAPAGFPALRHRAFRRYVLGQGVSLVGFWMQSVAQGWLVYRLSGSALALGAVSFCGYLPVLLLAPVAGVVADRVRKRELILLTQSAALFLAVLLGTLVAFHLATVPLVAVIAFCLGIVGAFDLPTRQSFLIEMVGGEDLPSAIALNASIFNTARVVGPFIAGILVAAVGEAPCFIINGLSYLGVLWALRGIPSRAVAPTTRSATAELRSGLRYIRRRPALMALLLALGLVSGLSLQANMLMPALAAHFAAGSVGYGMLLTAYGTGAVVTALRLASRRWTSAQHRTSLLGGLLVFATGLLGVAMSSQLWMALVCQVIAGLGMIRFTATTNTLIQLLVDDSYRGRIMGLHTVMFMGTAPLGSLILGALAQRLGPQPALVVSGTVPLLALAFLATRVGGAGAFSRARGDGTQN